LIFIQTIKLGTFFFNNIAFVFDVPEWDIKISIDENFLTVLKLQIYLKGI